MTEELLKSASAVVLNVMYGVVMVFCHAQQIIECNNQLRTGLERGVKVEGGQGLMELWDFLQVRGWSLISSHALLCWQRT